MNAQERLRRRRELYRLRRTAQHHRRLNKNKGEIENTLEDMLSKGTAKKAEFVCQ